MKVPVGDDEVRLAFLNALQQRLNAPESIPGKSIPPRARLVDRREKRANAARDIGGGEYEFTVPAFRILVNYPELFVMSAFGRNRKLIQIFNKYDTCCARGIGVSTYVADMKSILADLGEGAYEQYIDDTHVSHAISDSAMALILADLATMN